MNRVTDKDLDDIEYRNSSYQENMMQLVCFKLAQEEYAVNIYNTDEVIKVSKITPVPQMPEFVLGVVNLRGNVYTVFDLRKKFGLPGKIFDKNSKILVLDTDGSKICIIVDMVLDNIKIKNDMIDPSPKIKSNVDKEYIQGLCILNDRIIVILDVKKVNDSINKELGVYSVK